MQKLPLFSEPNESLEQPLLHIFTLGADVRFSSLWEIYSDNISTHERVERSGVPNKEAHQSRYRTSTDGFSQLCVNVWVFVWVSLDVKADTHTDNQGLICTWGPTSQRETLRKTRLDSVCGSLINQQQGTSTSLYNILHISKAQHCNMKQTIQLNHLYNFIVLKALFWCNQYSLIVFYLPWFFVLHSQISGEKDHVTHNTLWLRAM